MSSALYRTFRNYMRSAQRELRMVVYHPRYITLLTLGVVFSYVFFLTLMSEGQPEKLPIAVVDQDGSFLSRRLCHELSATQGVEVVAVFDNHLQARDAMQRLRIFAFLEIPKGTYNEVLQFRRPTITIYSNNAYLLGGSFSYKSLATMTKLACGAVQREVLRKKGYDEKTIGGLIQPVELDTHPLANPTVNYQPYILTTVLPGIVGLMLLMLTIMHLQDWVRNPYERLYLCHGDLMASIWGKLLPYTVWFSLMAIIGNLVMFGFCHFPINGSFFTLSVAMVLYLLALQAMGILLVGLIPETHMSICIGAIYGTLAFTLSGFSYPASSMPGGMHAFGYIFPLRHYYLAYVNIAHFGGTTQQILFHIAVLLAFMMAGYIGIALINKRLSRDGVWKQFAEYKSPLTHAAQ
ncbi:MAG: ABC transporter permease [Bacteroidales bacterium]|nr:ABC transporter permease [Bacteroidales bacterium]